MFEPEIDRRCTSCGATVRKQAAFCPQCGQMLDQSNVEPNETDQTEAEAIEAQQPTQVMTDDGDVDKQQQVNDSSAIQGEATSSEPLIVRTEEGSGDGTEPPVTVHEAPSAYKTQPLFANPTLANATAAGLADANFKRPTNAPTRSDNRVLTRVDRIRKVSSVIDQAAYDPSLRFLLVAGVLFVVFVILMILSKVLG